MTLKEAEIALAVWSRNLIQSTGGCLLCCGNYRGCLGCQGRAYKRKHGEQA